jgi:hypothetical protein
MRLESDMLSNHTQKTDPSPFSELFYLDENDPPLGIVCEMVSPFHLQFPVEKEHLKPDLKAIATEILDLFAQQEIVFATQKNNGVEQTSFSLELDHDGQLQQLQFNVTHYDSAKMHIYVTIDGPVGTLLHLLQQTHYLLETIATRVHPYELIFTLPKSVCAERLNAKDIKELFKEQRTVYGVNEDEQAP